MLSAKGEQREHYEALLGSIQPEILEERADPSFTDSLSSFWGPGWMGGEYLPRLKRREVEIARVVLQSVTMDVFSLRARWGGGRYHYRIVDEYDSTFLLCRKTSRRTLTLAQVIEILDTVDSPEMELWGRGIVARFWDREWEYEGDVERSTDFATVKSEMYPEIAAWYEQRAREWRAERLAGQAEDRAGALAEGEERESEVKVSLVKPDGWWWVDEAEWREEIEEWDVDLEGRVGVVKADFAPPRMLL